MTRWVAAKREAERRVDREVLVALVASGKTLPSVKIPHVGKILLSAKTRQEERTHRSDKILRAEMIP